METTKIVAKKIDSDAYNFVGHPHEFCECCLDMTNATCADHRSTCSFLAGHVQPYPCCFAEGDNNICPLWVSCKKIDPETRFGFISPLFRNRCRAKLPALYQAYRLAAQKWGGAPIDYALNDAAILAARGDVDSAERRAVDEYIAFFS